jgi:hypothetical protein
MLLCLTGPDRSLTQTNSITTYCPLGDTATAYVNQVQAGFGSNLPDAMKKIADAMARAERGADESSLCRAARVNECNRLWLLKNSVSGPILCVPGVLLSFSLLF